MAPNMCCATCFCFKDIRRAIVAIGMLTGACSLVQIFTTIAVFTGSNMVNASEMSDDGTTYRLYIALACFDFVIVILSFLLVYGNERSSGLSRCSILPWVIVIPFYFIYETATNIYYFFHQLNSENKYRMPLDGGSSMGFAIVPLVYWITKAILVFTSWIYLIVHMQQANPTTKVRYVRQVESCHEYDSAPTFPHPTPRMSLPPAPSIPGPPMMSMPSSSCCPKPQMMSMPPSTYIPKPQIMSMPTSPYMPKPSAPQCSSCSGGCSADRCNRCNLPQPLYSYAGGMQGGNTGNVQSGGGAVQSKGWTTSIYNSGN